MITGNNIQRAGWGVSVRTANPTDTQRGAFAGEAQDPATASGLQSYTTSQAVPKLANPLSHYFYHLQNLIISSVNVRPCEKVYLIISVKNIHWLGPAPHAPMHSPLFIPKYPR